MSKIIRPLALIAGALLTAAIPFFPAGTPIALKLLALGAGTGLSFLGRAGKKQQFERPQVPVTPPPLSTTVKASTAPRLRAYGRVRQSGVRFFAETTTNKRYLFYGFYLNDGPIDGYDAVFSDEELVPLQQAFVDTGSYWVFINGFWVLVSQTALSPNIFVPLSGTKYSGSNLLTSSIIAIEPGNGSLSGYPSFLIGPHPVSLDANWGPIWDKTHLGIGATCFYTRADATVAAGDRFKIFPNGFPEFSFIYRGARVYDPRDSSQTFDSYDQYNSTWKWSENPALVAADYVNWLIAENLTAIKGINWLSIVEAANDCDRLVPMRRTGFNDGALGFEPFARISALVTLDIEPRDVLSRMMETCDADYGVDQNGLFTMSVGKWREPSITFTGSDIGPFVEEFGPSSNSESNYMRTTYVEPRHNNQRVEAPIYKDTYSISVIGRRTASMDLEWVTSANQAYRLAARRVKRSNRKRRINASIGARAMTALKQRVIRLDAPEIGLFGVFEIDTLKPDGSLANWQASLIEVTPDIFEDEAAPNDTIVNFAIINPPTLAAPTTLITLTLKTRDGFGVAQISLDVNKNIPDSAVPNITAAALLTNPTLQIDGRWSVDGGANFTNFDTFISQFIMQSPELASGTQVTMQARWVSLAGSNGPYSTSVNVTII